VLTYIVDWSLRHRWTVLVGALVLIITGALSLRALPLDAFPDTTPTQVTVNTIAPALSPVEIERQLTVPLEKALAGLPHLEEMRSISKFGLSQITLRFSDETDVWFARQQVAERTSRVELPEGLQRPSLGPVATGLGEVFHYIMKGNGQSLEELRTLHDWVIAPQLRGVAGVAEVNSWGGNEKQWHVVVDPGLLQKYDLSLGDVYEALERNNANVGGGTVERGGSTSLVLGVGALEGGESIGDVVIAAHQGVPIRVRDVATVEVGHEIRRAAVTADGEGEVVLGLGFMLIGANSDTVTRALAKALDELKSALPEGVTAEPVYERTELVDHVLSTVKRSLLEGALLVIAVLFLFLGNLRAGLIVASAIPLSMLFAANGMLWFGIAGTLMSLGAIDFGLIVDSSVILVENAERHLTDASARGRRILEVVRDAAVEVRKPTLFGELIIMVVYLPILALEGVEGKLFRPMALTVIFALLGSILVSMTVMPVLASLALRKAAHHGHADPWLVRGLKRVYLPVLGWALRYPKTVLGSALLLVVAAGVGATRLGSEFVPRLSEGTIVVNTIRLAEVSLTESVRYGVQLEKLLLDKFPDEIQRIWTRTGTPEVATDPMGLELSDVFVTLKPREVWKRATTQAGLVQEMQSELEGMPGMRMSFLQPIEMRVNEMIAGVRSDVGVKLFGDDLDILKSKAQEIERILRALPGAGDVTFEQVTGAPVLEVTVDRAAISRYGIPARAVLDVVEAMGIRKVGQVREGERRFDLGVRLMESFRDPEEVKRVLVAAPSGNRVPLGHLAKVQTVAGPTTIQREWGKRRIVVQTNVRDRDLGSFIAEARSAIDLQVDLPDGYFVRFGGQFENLERARLRLLVVVPLALGLVFMLLFLTYRNVAESLRPLLTGVPFALVGGIAALLLTGLPFSISAAIGFIALSGIAMLGDMVFVSRTRQLLEGGTEIETAVREAAVSRFRPVLMTAAVALLGFVPMALATGVGAEVQRPLATVVIGGIISSTLLTLIVLPVLYPIFARLTGRDTADSTEEQELGATGAVPDVGVSA
jgi:cobalt-zinc-cadmium resistance protein CzcA